MYMPQEDYIINCYWPFISSVKCDTQFFPKERTFYEGIEGKYKCRESLGSIESH